MFRNRPRRAGFTLPEVLVTVAIVAVLAAVVVPTVTNQIGKGDDSNLTSNVASLRTALTAFVSDVRKFPSRVQHLTVQPLDTANDITGGDYGAVAVSRWRGPYQTGSLKAYNATPQDSILVGHAYMIDVLTDTNFPTGKGYVGLSFGGVASDATAAKIDSLIDGGTGSATGVLRWTSASGAPVGGRLTMLLMGR